MSFSEDFVVGFVKLQLDDAKPERGLDGETCLWQYVNHLEGNLLRCNYRNQLLRWTSIAPKALLTYII